jgi:hypothetical protein
MVVVAARRSERYDAVRQVRCLALDSPKFAVALGDEVVARVLAEGEEDVEAGDLEGQDDRERRAVADLFRVFACRDVAMIANRSDGTMGAAPE